MSVQQIINIQECPAIFIGPVREVQAGKELALERIIRVAVPNSFSEMAEIERGGQFTGFISDTAIQLNFSIVIMPIPDDSVFIPFLLFRMSECRSQSIRQVFTLVPFPFDFQSRIFDILIRIFYVQIICRSSNICLQTVFDIVAESSNSP